MLAPLEKEMSDVSQIKSLEPSFLQDGDDLWFEESGEQAVE